MNKEEIKKTMDDYKQSSTLIVEYEFRDSFDGVLTASVMDKDKIFSSPLCISISQIKDARQLTSALNIMSGLVMRDCAK